MEAQVSKYLVQKRHKVNLDLDSNNNNAIAS